MFQRALTRFAKSPLALRIIIALGHEINEPNADGFNLLHGALASRCSPQIIRMLLRAGADPNALTKSHLSALHIAVAREIDPEIIALLTSFGADPDARSEDGQTPLHVAAAFLVALPVMRALLEADAEIDPCDDSGKSPLCIAAAKGSLVHVAELLAAGASVSGGPGASATPLHLAVVRPGAQAVVRALLGGGAEPSRMNARGQSCLEVALPEYSALLAAGSRIR